MKDYIKWAALAFLAYLIIQFPSDMAGLVADSRDLVARSVEGLTTFVRGILNA